MLDTVWKHIAFYVVVTVYDFNIQIVYQRTNVAAYLYKLKHVCGGFENAWMLIYLQVIHYVITFVTFPNQLNSENMKSKTNRRNISYQSGIIILILWRFGGRVSTNTIYN